MPSTTIIAQPQQLMPAYNPIKYIIDNTNKNEPGFRYIFTINDHFVAETVAQYKTLPVFGTGYDKRGEERGTKTEGNRYKKESEIRNS